MMIEESKTIKSDFDIQYLLECQKEFDKISKTQIDEAIILIGSTGSGKSALINGLTGKKLIVKRIPPDNPKNIIIELAEGQEGLKINHNKVISSTSKPEIIQDKNKSIYYLDCPGFRDAKSSEQEIRK